MAADFALVALNWLLIGALLVPLRVLFPHVRSFGYRRRSAGFSVGHRVAACGVDYIDGLHRRAPCRRPRPVGGRRAFWASRFCGRRPCCALFTGCRELRGRSAVCSAERACCISARCWTWRWQSAGEASQRSAEVRNVLIVGAGGVGRRVAAYVEGHPEAGRTVCGFLDNERPLGNGVIGRVSDLARLARTGFVDEVILAAPHDRELDPAGAARGAAFAAGCGDCSGVVRMRAGAEGKSSGSATCR